MTTMFILGGNNNSIFQYTLGTDYDLSTASFDNVTFEVSAGEGVPTGFFFNPAGTRMFIIGSFLDPIYQYTLSVGFDLSTATYDNVSLNVTSEDGGPSGIFFNSTGTKMFMVGAGGNFIFQYTLGTSFDLSTVTYDGVSLDVTNEDYSPLGIFFNSTGTRMFMVGSQNDSVYQYTLGTGFDLSTASYDNVSLDISTEDKFPGGIFFNSTGTKMFMVGQGNASVYQYTLNSSFNLSTATYDSLSFDLSTQDFNPTSIFCSP